MKKIKSEIDFTYATLEDIEEIARTDEKLWEIYQMIRKKMNELDTGETDEVSQS